jgi:ribosomal protein S27E
MKRNLKMKCPNCGHWNRVPVNKLFVEQPSPEPKVKVMIPMYEPLQVSNCEKCGKIIAEPSELIKIVKGEKLFKKKSG